METKQFLYGKQQLNSLAIKFLLLGLFGLIGIYYFWFLSSKIYLIPRIGILFITLLGFAAFIYIKFFGRKPDEIALSIGPEGITANTTPICKAAGLISWEDISNVQYYGKQIDLEIRDPQKYASRMKNFFVRDTYLKSMKGLIRISVNEVNVSEKELSETLNRFKNK